MSVERTYWSGYDPSEHYTKQGDASRCKKSENEGEEVDGSFINKLLQYCIDRNVSIDEITGAITETHREVMEKFYPKPTEREVVECDADEITRAYCDNQCFRCVYR